MERSALGTVLVSIAVIVPCMSWFFAKKSQVFAMRFGLIDHPTGGKKIHTTPTPLIGGLPIGALLLICLSIVGYVVPSMVHQVVGWQLGITVLLIGGYLDDRYNLPAWKQFLFVFSACLLSVLIGGFAIAKITHPMGGVLRFNWMPYLSSLLAFIWILIVTYATKLMDGIDGLVTGKVIIGSGLILALTLTQKWYQPEVAIVATIVGSVFLGFLPHNLFPAKQFLGEAGSTIAGFSLAVLAIMSGAKLATALMVLSLPLVDLALVVLGRWRRGASLFQGDATHLHHKLLKAGLDKTTIVVLLWSIMASIGAMGLFVQTRGKMLLLLLLCAITAGLSFWAGRKAK